MEALVSARMVGSFSLFTGNLGGGGDTPHQGHATWGPSKFETASTQVGQMASVDLSIPEWARCKGVLPIHVTIEHDFDKLIFTAVHPNSRNTTLAQQAVYIDDNKETKLYVVYANEPEDRDKPNAAAHKGCYELRLVNDERTKGATSAWRLRGTYWTDKVKSKESDDDRGTWGDIHIHWESRKVGESKVNFTQQRFDVSFLQGRPCVGYEHLDTKIVDPDDHSWPTIPVDPLSDTSASEE